MFGNHGCPTVGPAFAAGDPAPTPLLEFPVSPPLNKGNGSRTGSKKQWHGHIVWSDFKSLTLHNKNWIKT
jgi:hypothetical protein